MKKIIQYKWLVMLAMLSALAVLFFIAPNMGELVREKGQIDVPEGYSSKEASVILANAGGDEKEGNEGEAAIVFFSDKKLTEQEISEAKRAVESLKDNKDLKVTGVLTHFDNESLEEQLVSEDGSAILASISFEWDGREPAEMSEALYKALDGFDVNYEYTSEWMISEALIASSEEGLKKTEGITIVFILIVLLLVFRSVVAPIIPLLAVGFSYLASQSIVAILADQFDFPLSNYTQIFLVAVLFGIGTDYCILLLSRYKEELGQSENISEAIANTYKNAGRTVFFSGIAVMIGFAVIGLSQFILYQSAAAVAIGVAVLLAALFTIVPFFMAVLGDKLFWPSKASAGHGDSRIWAFAGSFSLARPLLALLLVAVVTVPVLLTYDRQISYNSIEELSDDYPAIKGYNAIADSFGPGESMPTQVVLKNDDRMDTEEYLSLAEEITTELEKLDHVGKVRSLTRPTGDRIDDLYVTNQAGTLESGLGEGQDGINQIRDGLQEAENQLTESEPRLEEAVGGIRELSQGTSEIQAGLGEIGENLSLIQSGIRDGSMGSAEIAAGLREAKAGAEQLRAGYESLLGGYKEVGQNLSAVSGSVGDAAADLEPLTESLGQLDNQAFESLEQRYQGIAGDPVYLGMKGTIQGLQAALPSMIGNMNELNSGLAELAAAMGELNTNFAQANEGQSELIAGLDQMIAGLEELQTGLDQLADGQGQIVSNMPQLTNGLGTVNAGQQQLLEGFGGINDQLGELTDGLGKSAEGLGQVSEGLGSAREYLGELSASEGAGAIHIPQETLKSDEFAQVLDTYLSPDRKVMTFDVIFETNPYSMEVMDQVEQISAAVETAVKDTKLENADLAIGGISSTNHDLDTMSEEDFTRTVILMLAGIGLVLVLLFRSVIMPLYLIGSLILTYFTSMAVNELIFVNILGYSGIGWAVPFFAFVILVALGVDYSIFLMDRFNEYRSLTVTDAILEAMKKMGTVIISAAIILGGTFAAMIPSGMLSLMQIASVVIVGLLLYALIMLPLFVPVMVKNFGEANWWPFRRQKIK